MRTRLRSRAVAAMLVPIACVSAALAQDGNPLLKGDPDLQDPVIFNDATVGRTALDAYVAAEDPAFAWELIGTERGEGVTSHLLRVTSQKWRDEPEVSHPIWQHWLRVAVPDELATDTPVFIIGGGSRRAEVPGIRSPRTELMASTSGAVVARLFNVPNQPLELSQDGSQRWEDDLIAESWLRFAGSGDPTWVLQLPMVKAASAGMTATQQFLAELDEPIEAESFTAMGASKRGWTSWLVAAVDDRVTAIVPLVIDTLNMPRTIRHHWGAYGFWAPALGDYAGRQIARWTAQPEFRFLRELVDPYLYRDRLTMPKYLLNSAGDEYFLPDTTKYYVPELPGETRMRFVPNSDHGVGYRPDVFAGALAFHLAASEGREIPSLDWSAEAVGAEGGQAALRLTVRPGALPESITLWVATNPKARDFRQEEIGDVWEPTTLTPDEGGVYTATVAEPEKGFRAALVEVTMPVEGQELPVIFSTEVFVIPDVLPFRDTMMK